MKNGIKVYQNEEGYHLELWGASTKHPDSIFHMKDFQLQECIEEEYQVFQWLLECASKLIWPVHAKQLAEYALKEWYKF